jgi:SAM-dependent methyltransferase
MSAEDACFACGGEGVVLRTNVRDLQYSVEGVWSHRRCRNCGLMWLDPMPGVEDLDAFYSDYYTHNERRLVERSGWRRLVANVWPLPNRARQRSDASSFYLSKSEPGSVLEVGCGDGRNLLSLREAGWRVTGQEIDASAAARARANGIPVVVGPLHAVLGEVGVHDAVILSHVVEHLLDPIAELGRIHTALRPTGRLVCVTPNATGLTSKMFGRWWRGLEVPRHIYVYTPESLSRLLTQAGFADVRVSTRSFATEAYAAASTEAALPRLPHRARWAAGKVGGIAAELIAQVIRADERSLGDELVALARA